METVDKKVQYVPMRIGIGPIEHHETLRLALGCENVFDVDKIDGLMELDVCPLRQDADDVAVFIRPNYLSPAHMAWLATSGAFFEVAGHDPIRLRSWQERQDFRTIEPKIEGVVVGDNRGAKAQYQVSDEHLDDAIADWHAGDMAKGKWATDYTLKQIEERMRLRTGLDIKATWVRDKVKQRFGSAKRNPN